MSVPKKISYINQLASDFWLNYYQDADIIDKAMGSVAEVLKSQYFRLIQKSAPRSLDNFPIFREEFWNLLELDTTEAQLVVRNNVEYFRYPLDEPYADVPLLYNVVYKPTKVLKQNRDFIIERVKANTDNIQDFTPTPLSVQSFILFKRVALIPGSPYNGDPFTSNEIAKRVGDDNKIYVSLFAPKSYMDDGDLYHEYGSLFKIEDVSSELYANFLKGLMRLYLKGPTIANLNAGVNLAVGYPVARDDETIVSIELQNDPEYSLDEFVLTSDKGNEYIIPRIVVQELDGSNPPVIINKVLPNLKFSSPEADLKDVNLVPFIPYKVNFPVSKLDTFISDIRIVDSVTEPKWWKKQEGKISSQLISGLPEEVRNNPENVDYFFERYLKFNTFGVFLDFRLLRPELKVLGDFISILSKIKSSNKAFLIYEEDLKVLSVDYAGNTQYEIDTTDPENPIEVFTGVKMETRLILEDSIQTPILIGMGLLSAEHRDPKYDKRSFGSLRYTDLTDDYVVKMTADYTLNLNPSLVVPYVTPEQHLRLIEANGTSGTNTLFLKNKIKIDQGFIIELEYKNTDYQGVPNFGIIFRDGTLDVEDNNTYTSPITDIGYDASYRQLVIEFDSLLDIFDATTPHIAVMGSTTTGVEPYHDEVLDIWYNPLGFSGSHKIKLIYTGTELHIYYDDKKVLQLSINLSQYVPVNENSLYFGLFATTSNTHPYSGDFDLKNISILEKSFIDPNIAKPIEIGMNLEYVNSSWSTARFLIDWNKAYTEYPLNEGKPLVIGAMYGDPAKNLEIGSGLAINQTEYVELCYTEAPLLSTVIDDVDLIGPHKLITFTATGEYDNFMVIRDNQNIGISYDLIYKDYLASGTHDYSVKLIKNGFMSKISNVVNG